MHIRTIDLRSGTTQVMGPDNRRLERPQPGGSGGRTVAATYFVESTVPLPPADKCEIDLSGVVENLQGAVKTYAVVDPAAKGLFEWLVQQGGSVPRQGPVSETLFCGEPVLFFAGWRPGPECVGGPLRDPATGLRRVHFRGHADDARGQ